MEYELAETSEWVLEPPFVPPSQEAKAKSLTVGGKEDNGGDLPEFGECSQLLLANFGEVAEVIGYQVEIRDEGRCWGYDSGMEPLLPSEVSSNPNPECEREEMIEQSSVEVMGVVSSPGVVASLDQFVDVVETTSQSPSEPHQEEEVLVAVPTPSDVPSHLEHDQAFVASEDTTQLPSPNTPPEQQLEMFVPNIPMPQTPEVGYLNTIHGQFTPRELELEWNDSDVEVCQPRKPSHVLVDAHTRRGVSWRPMLRNAVWQQGLKLVLNGARHHVTWNGDRTQDEDRTRQQSHSNTTGSQQSDLYMYDLSEGESDHPSPMRLEPYCPSDASGGEGKTEIDQSTSDKEKFQSSTELFQHSTGGGGSQGNALKHSDESMRCISETPVDATEGTAHSAPSAPGQSGSSDLAVCSQMNGVSGTPSPLKLQESQTNLEEKGDAHQEDRCSPSPSTLNERRPPTQAANSTANLTVATPSHSLPGTQLRREASSTSIPVAPSQESRESPQQEWQQIERYFTEFELFYAEDPTLGRNLEELRFLDI